MSLMQRNKGKRWERAVADALREAMPGADIRRGWQSRSGSDEADVITPLYWIECKCGKAPNPRAALRQAQAASPGGKWILAVIKDDRQEPFCVLAFDDMFDIMRELQERGGTLTGYQLSAKGAKPNLRKELAAADEIRLPGTITAVCSPDERLVALRWADMLRIIRQHWRLSQE